MQNYYDLLGVSKSASLAEIKAAYKKRAFETHPDKNPATEELFKQINVAYQTLSDPIQRERYDFNFAYREEVNTTHVHNRPRPQPHHYYRYRQRRRQPEYQRWLSKENLQATLYAFLFALGVGTLVMAAIKLNDFYKEKQYAAFLAERRITFGQAQAEYEKGNYSGSLSLVASLGGLRSSEEDIDLFRRNMVSQIFELGMDAYRSKNFSLALRYFDLVKGFSVIDAINFKKILADCHLGLKQYDKGLEILRTMLVEGHRDLDILLKIADVYENEIQNNQQALTYYEWGNKITLEEYEGIYGKAFPLLLSRYNVPASHYTLQLGLARTYFKTNQYQKAIDAAQWSVAIWPDSVANFMIKAESAMAMNNLKLACDTYIKARKIDNTKTVPDACR